MYVCEQLASFVVSAESRDLSPEVRRLLKRNVLDSVGCAIGALDGPPLRSFRQQLDEFGGHGLSTLIGGGRTSPDRAAMYNSALVRYLDFMDNFLAGEEICHPSDNLAGVLAAAEYANRSGLEFLTALAVAYQVQCRLTESMPIMARGLNHTTQQSLSVAAGVARLLGLDGERTAHAIAMAGVDAVALAITQGEPVSQWKGLSSADTAMRAVHNAFLAARGVTGPIALFEGHNGLNHLVRKEIAVDWQNEPLDAVTRTSLKQYNAEVQAQSVIEGTIELRDENEIRGESVAEVTVYVPRGTYDVIGGGEYGDKSNPTTKEQADHNLRYIVAVALLDGEVGPSQYAPQRILDDDVQSLLLRVTVQPKLTFTRKYPREMPARIIVTMEDGRSFQKDKSDYEGFRDRPMSWQKVVEKFERLARPHADERLCRDIIAAVDIMDTIPISQLTQLLARVRSPALASS
jgi:2-methylcitrate dehydratase